MNTCPACGKTITEDSYVCGNCGFEVAKSETNQTRLDKNGATDIRSICPHCGTERTLPDSALGKLVQCGHCKKNFVVKTPEPFSPPLKVKIPKQTQPLETPAKPENSNKNETATASSDENVEDSTHPSSIDFVKPTEPDISVENAPGTTPPDSSAVLLEGVGQAKIAVGWIVGICFGFLIGIIVGGPVGTIAGLLIGLISVWNGYAQGAKEKATAKASINATKAAERTARMEQMLVNMVNQDSFSASGNEQKPVVVTTIVCPKCRTQLPTSSKFCSECGFSLRKKCEKCGTELSASSKFCPECGTRQ